MQIQAIYTLAATTLGVDPDTSQVWVHRKTVNIWIHPEQPPLLVTMSLLATQVSFRLDGLSKMSLVCILPLDNLLMAHVNFIVSNSGIILSPFNLLNLNLFF